MVDASALFKPSGYPTARTLQAMYDEFSIRARMDMHKLCQRPNALRATGL